jgi:hypothetical protein
VTNLVTDKKIPSFGGDEFFIRRESGSFSAFSSDNGRLAFQGLVWYFLGLEKRS